MSNLGLAFGANTLTHDLGVTDESLGEMAPLFKTTGVQIVEFPFPAVSLEDPVGSVGRFKQASGVKGVLVCHFYVGDAPNPLDPGQEKAALESLERACSFAASIGAAKVSGPLGLKIGVAGTRGQMVAYLKKAVVIAEKHNVVLCIEPLREEEDKVLGGFGGAIEVVKAVGSKFLMIHYDSFHDYMWAGSPDQTLSTIGSLLGNVHISGSERMPPGLYGESVDWNLVRAGLEAAKYTGPVVLELFGPNCRAAMEGIVDPRYPRSLSTLASLEVARFTLERAGIIAPLAAKSS